MYNIGKIFGIKSNCQVAFLRLRINWCFWSYFLALWALSPLSLCLLKAPLSLSWFLSSTCLFPLLLSPLLLSLSLLAPWALSLCLVGAPLSSL